MKKTTLLTVLFLLAVSSVLFAQAPSTEQYAIKAKPLLQPCEEWKDGEDAAITKAKSEIATTDAAGKMRIAAELGKSCHQKSLEPLLTLLADKDPLVRAAAAEGLGQLGHPDAIDPLMEAVKDPDWRVRFAVGPALCVFQKQKSSYAALNYLVVFTSSEPVTEGDARARGITTLAINQLRDVNFSRKTLFYLFGLLEHQDPAVQKIAQETMHALRDTKNGPYELIGLLKISLNPMQRKKCAYWLGELKIEKGRDLLTQVAAEDADENVKKAAAEALQKLGPGSVEAASEPPTKKSATAPKVSKAIKAAPAAKTKSAVKK